ncbi:TraR/DksA family transcriptional regulator [Sneathiella sp. HT1-7]|jgi:DnaK suppressor protein|uniref:TraR/DksA family transcriptional regulator n=1 Tax=Sneathiella sp. HT1-7 TaxID=2887192 RepID=UPI001D14711A|nr:TraR/DksA C4-type zinc finger protein [Sneathiella sp. HT1-7]MCC3304377.1 TraR/DksA C4-type zinc finger protein [Sneathiella sp. HT1-7]
MTKTDPRKVLLARREELLSVMKASTEGSRPVELDQTRVGRLSRMDALQGQAMAQETERRRKNELQRIDAALARVDTRNYGYCVNCDEEISVKRLSLDPSTPLCIDCASG